MTSDPTPPQTVYVNKPRMLSQLQLVAAQDDLANLRARTLDLGTALACDESCMVGGGDIIPEAEVVALSRQYLLDELDQIADSQTLERARYYVGRLARAIAETRTSEVNDINLNRWKEYGDVITDSLWVLERRDSTGAHTAGYWGNFIPQIPNQLMRRFTRKGEWVLDTFAGCGTTLIESQRLGRNAIGVELQTSVVEKTRELIRSEPNEHGVVADVREGDSATVDFRSILRQYGRDSVQLVIMHPPYSDIIRFSDDPRDLCNAPSVEAFLAMLSSVVENASSVLESGRYLALVIGDKYSKGEWVPLGFQAMSEVLRRGFSLKSIIVKNYEQTAGKRSQAQLWRYRALVGGFYIFKHEYIFLFRKSKR